MSNEWQELPNMLSIAQALTDGWEIEINYNNMWSKWTGKIWTNYRKYRGRPKPPVKQIVTSECWRHHHGDLIWKQPNWKPYGHNYHRFPAGDITGEVNDNC